MPLSDVRHQEHAQAVLQRALARDRVPHAYLFFGPDGVGKEHLAMGLSQRLLCTQPVTRQADAVGGAALELLDACGTCKDCHTIAAGTHPDVHLVHRHQNREHPDAEIRKRTGLELGIEVIRHFLLEKTGLTSVVGRGKVFVVREADRISSSAQNAMLKTLEEPPPGTYIILLATAAERLLPTTLSRCQSVRFDTLPAAFVEQKLAELAPQAPAEQRSWYAHLSDGSIGQALQRVEEDMFAVNGRVVPMLAEMVQTGRPLDAAAWVKQADDVSDHFRARDRDISDAEATRQALKSLLKLAATWYADVVRAAAGGADSGLLVNLQHVAAMGSIAGRIGAERAAQSVRRFAKAERQLDQNVNTQLVMDSLFIDLARIAVGRASPMVGT